jgi:hypothetical protein
MRYVISYFGAIFPCFLQKTTVRKKTPSYWQLLPEDVYLLSLKTQQYRTLLEPFVNDPLLLPIFENCIERIQPMLEYIEYVFFAMETKTTSEFFEIALFVLHGIFLIWIGLIEHPDIYKIVSKTKREMIEMEMEETRIRSNSNTQLLMDEPEEIDITSIQIEQKDEIQQRLAAYK